MDIIDFGLFADCDGCDDKGHQDGEPCVACGGWPAVPTRLLSGKMEHISVPLLDWLTRHTPIVVPIKAQPTAMLTQEEMESLRDWGMQVEPLQAEKLSIFRTGHDDLGRPALSDCICLWKNGVRHPEIHCLADHDGMHGHEEVTKAFCRCGFKNELTRPRQEP